MAAKTRRQYAGGAAQTSLVTSITSVATSASIASTTGWPSTPAVPFYVVIDPDTSVEEKCLATISGSTLTLTRGQDGTVAAAHDAGATIYPVFTAVDADEANELASKFTAKGDIVTQGASTFETTSVGTNNQLLKADSSAAGGVAWATYSPVITLGGDLTGSVTLTNLGSGTLTATVAANSVALGTDTTGNYVSDVTAGTGITVTHTPGEGSSAAVAIDGTVATLAGSQTLTNKTIALGSNTVSGTTAQFDAAVTDDNFAYVGTANTFTTNQVISASSSSDLLRITQTGSGNALVVEDSANPDSTPTIIDATGRVVVGATTAATTRIGATTITAPFQILGTTNATASSLFGRYSNDVTAPNIFLAKSRDTSIGSFTTVAAADQLGVISFAGADGTQMVEAARITVLAEGTVSTGVVPGLLTVNTASSAGTLTERMRIDSAGQVGIGVTPSAGDTLRVAKNITGAVNCAGVYVSGAIQSDVTTATRVFRSTPSTANSNFTMTSLHHYAVVQGTYNNITAGGAITNQYGFSIGTMSGPTNNYGFFSQITAATGAWNLYMEGTAANYLAGRLGVGATLTSGAMALINNTTAADVAFIVRGAASQSGDLLSVQNSAATALFTIGSGGQLRTNTSTDVSPLADVTPDIQLSGTGNDASMGINRFSANADPSRLLFVKSRNATIGSHTVAVDGDNIMTIQALASDGTSYIEAARITASVDGTPGTNDMPGRLVFATTADGGTTLTERMRITNAGNIGFNMSTFSGALVLAIGNGTAPSANPTNGGYLYVESGALKYRGSSGTITTIANA